jgi:hypothetical protein
MAPMNSNYIFDANLQLKDAGAVTATGVGQVAAANKIIDLGDADMAGDLVIDVSAIDVVTGDEAYTLILEGSDVSDFSTGTPRIVPLATILLGGGTAILGAGATASGTGRHVLPFTNTYGGKRSRYVRIEHVIAGTTPSINYVAYMSIGRPM